MWYIHTYVSREDDSRQMECVTQLDAAHSPATVGSRVGDDVYHWVNTEPCAAYDIERDDDFPF